MINGTFDWNVESTNMAAAHVEMGESVGHGNEYARSLFTSWNENEPPRDAVSGWRGREYKYDDAIVARIRRIAMAIGRLAGFICAPSGIRLRAHTYGEYLESHS